MNNFDIGLLQKIAEDFRVGGLRFDLGSDDSSSSDMPDFKFNQPIQSLKGKKFLDQFKEGYKGKPLSLSFTTGKYQPPEMNYGAPFSFSPNVYAKQRIKRPITKAPAVNKQQVIATQQQANEDGQARLRAAQWENKVEENYLKAPKVDWQMSDNGIQSSTPSKPLPYIKPMWRP